MYNWKLTYIYSNEYAVFSALKYSSGKCSKTSFLDLDFTEYISKKPKVTCIKGIRCSLKYRGFTGSQTQAIFFAPPGIYIYI